MNFNKAINRLSKRASSSKLAFMFLLLVALLLVMLAFSIAIISLDRGNVYFFFETPEDTFDRRIKNALDSQGAAKMMVIDPDARSKLKAGEGELDKELEIILSQYERYISILKEKPVRESESNVFSSNVISQALISLGVVVFGILLLQILVMFMRYYARLAELYEAQATALEASEGDPELAYKFIEHFSPNSIELGKTPETLYQKVLETIQDVAKSKSQEKTKSEQ